MSELLPALVFGLVIGAQVLAVFAVHGLEQGTSASRDDAGTCVVPPTASIATV